MEQETILYIDQGTNFKYPINIYDDNGVPVDLSTATIKSQMRTGFKSVNAFDFTCHGNSAGEVELSMAYTLTSTIPDGRYVFDAFYTKDGDNVKFLKGLVVVAASVTSMIVIAP